MKRNLPVWLVAGFAVVVGPVLPAAAIDELSIQFDEVFVEESGNARTLSGNVVVQAAGIRIEADEVVQHFEDGASVRIEASGSPIVLTQSGTALQGLERGTARSLTLLVKERTLKLSDYELRFTGSVVQRGEQLTLRFQ